MSFIQKILPVILFTASIAIIGITLFSITEPNIEASAAQSLKEVSINDNVLGSPNAAVTIIEYSDFECPYCASLGPVLKNLLEKYPQDLRIVYRHFPLESIHPLATTAARAAEAAGKQGKFWEMHDLIFQHQDSLSEELILDMAKSITIDMEMFNKDLTSKEIASKVSNQLEDGKSLGIYSTPTLFINGKKLIGAQPIEIIEELIIEELKK